MKKLANMSLDIVDELLQDDMESLFEVIKDLPESAKTAHVPTNEEIAEIDEDNFALVMYHPELGFMKKFANYNADLTLLNANVFMKKADQLPDEVCEITGRNLYRAFKQFKLDIPETLNKYASDQYVNNVIDLNSINEKEYYKKINASSIPEQTKLAYALPNEQKFPIHDEFHQSRAIEFFEKNATALDINSRIEYAINLRNTTNKVSDKIEKYANIDLNSFNDEVEINIKSRKRHLKEANHKYINGLMSKLSELTPLQTSLYLEEIDKTFGLTDLYGKYIEDAPLSCFGLKKEASIKTKSGLNVTKKTINQICSHEKFASLVNDDMKFALNSDKALEIFELLPESFQNKLMELTNG